MTLMKIQTIMNPEFDFEIIKNTSPSYINPEFIVYITISDYCRWSTNNQDDIIIIKESEVDSMKIKKPHFYYMDLDNYNDDFLRKIILWQKDEIEKLEKKE